MGRAAARAVLTDGHLGLGVLCVTLAAGANLLSGVASTLLAAEDAELGLFEVDEAAMPDIARRVRPQALCLGNLFRDQLDRYGELELVAERWRGAVAELGDESWLVVNGDDPQVGDLARGRRRSVVFGMDDPRQAAPELQHAADSKWCLRCGTPYEYAAAYVGHLGDYRCPACGHARPRLDLRAREVELHGLDGVSFDLVDEAGPMRIRLRLPGLYNVYNALAAAALARVLGATREEIGEGLTHFRAAFGRFERLQLGDKNALVLLVKNPAGANEVVRTLLSGGPPRVAVIALNDGIADGRDVSWIWDVDFELLTGKTRSVTVSGSRAWDMALRLKYAGLYENGKELPRVEPEPTLALKRALQSTPDGGTLYVIPTYTAMLQVRDLLAGWAGQGAFWESE